VQQGFFPRVPANPDDVHILLGRTAYRTLHHYGLELASLRYNDASLGPLRARLEAAKGKRSAGDNGRPPNNGQVKIKYHPNDLSRIHVYDPFEGEYLEVPALAQTYTQGLSLWKHRVIRRFVLEQQQQVDIVALGEAKRQIQQVVEESKERTRLRTRARIGRWQSGGRTKTTDDPVLPGEPPTPASFDLELDDDSAGWGVSYTLPIHSQQDVHPDKEWRHEQREQDDAVG
jgi:putative transposase